MVHTHLLKTNFLSHVYSATALTDASMKLNLMDDTLKVFGEMPHRNLTSVNTVNGLLRNGHHREALKVLKSVGFGGFSYGELVSAAKLFEHMPVKIVVSYNAFITGLLQNGVPRVMLDVFKKMRACRGENPNSVTLVSILSACASVLYLRFGRQVHGLIMKVERAIGAMTGIVLMNTYSKCGCWQLAYQIFKEIYENRSFFTWKAMIAGIMLNAQ
ncbi:pentatricopeptide repeat-containing protein At2g02750-like [Rosa rugosa]|uniref:pentatricopeptide repeat-containing protein At2g02750-like n=1 Tax=Rosa rugosa TaxID=74645 RepID=UPI002B401C6B|nr:pentatricopeptide repeat-containing protein At2g02750-like [Rosa rugosa]